MQPLRTPNLDLSLDTHETGDIAVMEVTGKMKPDTLSESFEWFDALKAATEASGEDVQMMVIMRQSNFDDLSEAAGGFRQVADVLRRVPGTERCTVLTDSAWLRSTAKVESAVIPGLKIMVFDPSERENAARWLRDKPLMQPEPEEAKEEPKQEAPMSSGLAASVGKSASSSSAWAKLDLGKVDI